MKNDEDIIGQEVVAIAYITFSKIGIYGMGKLIDSDGDYYTVDIKIKQNKLQRIKCDAVVPMDAWQHFVDETMAEVRKIPYNSKET